MEKIRFGIIGSGGIANEWMLPELSHVKEAELVATADLYEDRARNTALRWGAKAWYTDYHELLEREDVDAVIVATYHPTHSPIAVEAIQKGKYVLIQKPMATKMEDADKLISASSRANVKVMALPYFYSNAYNLAKRLIDNGSIGKVFMGRSRVAHGGPEDYQRRLYPDQPVWFFDPKLAEGGALFDMGVYAVALITGLLGPAVRLQACAKTLVKDIKVDDNASVLLEFENGAIGSAETSWTQRESLEKNGAAVYGSEGTIYLNFGDTPLLVHTEKALTDELKGWVRPDISRGYSQTAHAHFVECIIKDKKPIATPEHQRHVVEIMCAAYESSKSGRRVKLRTRF